MSTLVVLQCGFLWLLSQNSQICDFQPHLFDDNKLWAKNTIFHSTSIHWRSNPREVAAVFAYIQSVSAFAGDDTSALSCFISFVRIFMPCFYDGESFLGGFWKEKLRDVFHFFQIYRFHVLLCASQMMKESMEYEVSWYDSWWKKATKHLRLEAHRTL